MIARPDPARVTVVHADRPPAAVTRAMIGALTDDGFAVDVLTASHAIPVTGSRPRAELFVLKHSDAATLVVGCLLHDAGAATFNPYPVVATCRDKAATTGRLAAAGLPTPDSWLVADPATAQPLLRDGPVVVKPNGGSKGAGVTVARRTADLRELGRTGGPFLVQRYHEPDRLDHKLYRIGDDVFCVGRPWPAVTAEDKQGVALEVDPVLRRLAMGVGDALGIDVFGADVVRSGGRAWLVDVSSFPGFKGVPDAGRLLARRIAAALHRRVSGRR